MRRVRSRSAVAVTNLEDAMRTSLLFRFWLAAVLLSPTVVPGTCPAACRRSNRPGTIWQANESFKKAAGSRSRHKEAEPNARSRSISGAWRRSTGPNSGSVLRTLASQAGLPADQVVSIEQAMAYFSDQIRDHPQDAFAHVGRPSIGETGRNSIRPWRTATKQSSSNRDMAAHTKAGPRFGCSGTTPTKPSEIAMRPCGSIRTVSWHMQSVAHAFILRKSFEKATTDLDHAIRLEHQLSSLFVARGCVRVASKEYEKALVDFSQAIRINPQDAGAYSNRATSWAWQEDYDKAFEDCNKALCLDPQRFSALLLRGCIRLKKRDYDKAAADFSEAIKAHRDDRGSFCAFAIVWDERRPAGRPDAARDVAIHAATDLAIAYANRGCVWMQKKQYDKAIADLSEAIRLDPELAGLYGNRGRAWFQKKEFDRAISDLDQCIRLDPKAPEFYLYRGRGWFAKSEYDKAIADYTSAIRLKPDNAYAAPSSERTPGAKSRNMTR